MNVQFITIFQHHMLLNDLPYYQYQLTLTEQTWTTLVNKREHYNEFAFDRVTEGSQLRLN